MSAKKTDAERFAEFVGKFGIERAQEHLDVMKGYETGKSGTAAAKVPRSSGKNKRTAAATAGGDT